MRVVLWILVAGLALLPLGLPPFYLTLANFVAFGALVALGLYLLTGLAGMTSFGQAAFMGVGAYTTALLTTQYGWSPWLTLPVGLLASALVALVLGGITVRLKGHYLPLSTIAWQMSVFIIMGSWVAFTGGHTGRTDLPVIRLAGLTLNTEQNYFYLAWGFTLLAAWGAYNLTNSRSGRALRALRGDAIAAASFGVNPALLKLQVFVLAALFASLAGWLYAHFLRFVNPTPFSLEASIKYLIAAVAGGVASLPGTILGSALVIALEEFLKDFLPRVFGRTGNYEIIAYGLILVLILVAAPRGLWPFVERWIPARPGRPPRGDGLLPVRHPTFATGQPVLKLESVTRRFGGLVANHQLTFELRQGEILGLIGPNGAGKSTCFNLITGVYPLSSGQIKFHDRSIGGLSPYQIHRLGIGRTFQHAHLFPEMTVLENAALGTYARTRAGMLKSLLGLDRREEQQTLVEAMQALERVGLADLAHRKADGLALGQQRLLEIARALASGPQVLLMDEPGAGLRSGEKRALAQLVRSLAAQGMTVLLVDHDMELVMGLVDRVVVMNYGEKLAEGSPRQVQDNPAVIEAYLGSEVTA